MPVVRLRAVFSAAFLLAVAGAGFAQTLVTAPSGVGRSSASGSIDPRSLPPAPRFPDGGPVRTTIPDHPVKKRTSNVDPVTPRLPGSYSGAPHLEVSNRSLSAPIQPRLPLRDLPQFAWEGIPDTTFVPPDPDLAVGPEDVLLVVNSAIARYTRAGQQTNVNTFFQFFQALLPTVCPNGSRNCIIFDPIIRYDQIHGRFVLVAASLDFITSASHFVIAVSGGATYGSTWRTWALNGATNNGIAQQIFVDQPKLGFDREAIYITGNAFNFSNVFLYGKLRILKKSEVYHTGAGTLTFTEFWDIRNADDSVASTLQPIHMRGRTQAPYSAGFFVAAGEDVDYLTIWKVLVPVSVAPQLVRSTISGLWRYDRPSRAPQLDIPATLDLGDTAILKAIWRDGDLYTARNTSYPGEPVTVTYDRIDTRTNKLIAQARWINGQFFYPAFDIPASLGTVTNFPNILPTGKNTNAAGQLSPIGFYNGSTAIKAGESLNASERWGDYFGGAVDPVNGGLWVYGQFSKPLPGLTSAWSTWAAYYPSSTSQTFNDVPPSHGFFDAINILGMWKVTLGCSPTEFCPDGTLTRAQMAAFIVRSLMGDDFTFPSTPFFEDTPSTHGLFKYVQKLRELEITAGCTPTGFCPDVPITRAQATTLIIRAKLRLLHGENFTFPATPYFTDVPAAHGFFKYIQKQRELGITQGCSATEFCPDASITRSEMAAFLVRAFLN